MKLTRNIKLFALALVCVVSAIFGVCSLNDKKTEVMAYTPAATGLTETTMDRVNMTEYGVATDVDYVAFERTDYSTYFLVEYEGQNVPNFGFRQNQAYSAWNKEDIYGGAGILAAQSFYRANLGVTSTRLGFTSGFNFISQWRDIQNDDGSKGEGIGLSNMETDKRYVSIVGLEVVGVVNANKYVYKLFTINDDNTLTLVQDLSAEFNSGAASGKVFTIYPNMGVGPEQITFKYAQPASDIASIIQSLGDNVAYKADISKKLGLGDTSLTSASLDKATVATQKDAASNVDYLLFDDYTDNSAYFLVDFYGQNAPNFVVKASEALSEWPACDGTWATVNSKTAGMSISQSGKNTSIYGNNWGSQAAVLWHGTTNVTASGADATNSYGLSDYVVGTHYVMIIGYEYVAGAKNDVLTQYVFSETDGVLTLVTSFTLTATETDSYIGTGTKVGFYSPINFGANTISFKYATPQPTLKELITELPEGYTYKTQISEEILGKKITIQDENGEELSAEYSKEENYTLPAYSKTGVIGFDIDGALYQAGSEIALTKSFTAKEVNLGLTMEDGASVRVQSTEDGYGGMRFTTTVNAEVATKYAENIALTGVVIPTDKISGTFDKDESGADTIGLTNFSEKNGERYYRITLTDVKYKNYNRAFSALAYATITYANGTTATIETTYDENEHSRSVYEVAVAALNDTEATFNDSQMDILKEYVGYVVTLVKNADGTYSCATEANDGLKDEYRQYTVSQNEGVLTITLSNIPTKWQGQNVSVTIYDGENVSRASLSATIESDTLTAPLTVGQ